MEENCILCGIPLELEDEHSELKIVASKGEHKQITTNADELLLEEPEEKKKGKKINIKVDANERIHLSKNLSKPEKEYLIFRFLHHQCHCRIKSSCSDCTRPH